jgi:hypothetical protein
MEPSQADKNFYGADVRLHPITNMPLESGIGHAPDDVQAWAHCDTIEHEHGKKAADAMRAKLGEYVKNPEDPALTRAKHAAELARTAADAATADAAAKVKLAEAADAKVEHLSKDPAKEPAPFASKPSPAFGEPAPFPLQPTTEASR